MKKYKLIKEYPNGPSLNAEAIPNDNSGYCNYTHKIMVIKGQATFGYINQNMLERYPQFWEEVIEKDYEILQLKGKNNVILDIKNYHNVDTCWNSLSKVLEIHSIKRLSDGEIFTIGDKIHNYGEITEMFLDKSYKTGVGIRSSIIGCIGLGSIEKTKQPIFTTEDGVDIFEDDYVVCLDISDKCPRLASPKHLVNSKIDKYNYKGDPYIYFSTKEASEDYILLNIPCLSINDLSKVLTLSNRPLKELQKLVKSRL